MVIYVIHNVIIMLFCFVEHYCMQLYTFKMNDYVILLLKYLCNYHVMFCFVEQHYCFAIVYIQDEWLCHTFIEIQ